MLLYLYLLVASAEPVDQIATACIYQPSERQEIIPVNW